MTARTRSILAGVVALVLAAATAALVFYLLEATGDSRSTSVAGTAPEDDGLAPGAFDQTWAPAPEAYEGLAARGAEVYAANCFVCHGGRGDGEGPWAMTLHPPARDFTDDAWMASQSDGDFVTSILRGVPGTPMPAFAGRLSQRDIWAVTAYIRGFSPGIALDRPEEGAASVEQGHEVFSAQCAGCHGEYGGGNGEAARLLESDPRELADGDWLSGHTDQQLRATIGAGIPETAMPGFYDELSRQEIDAVIAYLRSLAGVQHRPNPLSGWAQQGYRSYGASCHGVEGDGQGVAAARLDPEPRTFRNPAWMAGQTDRKLIDAVRNGRPGTAMPPFRALLSDAEIRRLVEYVRAFAEPEAIPGADSAYRYDPETVTGPPSGRSDRPRKATQ